MKSDSDTTENAFLSVNLVKMGKRGVHCSVGSLRLSMNSFPRSSSPTNKAG